MCLKQVNFFYMLELAIVKRRKIITESKRNYVIFKQVHMYLIIVALWILMYEAS